MSLLDDEIQEQPEAAARLLDAVLPRLPDLGALLRSRGAEQLLLVARGSSDNAARYAQYLWQTALGLPVSLATPSVGTVYGRTPDLRRHAVVAVSQSGASPDVVTVVEQAREQGRPTLAVTNVPDSPLGRTAEEVLDLGARPERSVAATKTYTASLLAVALLRVALDRPAPGLVEQLRRVPDALQAALDGVTGVEEAAALLDGHDRAVCVGRGLHLSTAHETALKVTELTGCLVAPYSPADLLHGPVAAVGPRAPAVLVAPPEQASASVLEIAPGLRRRGAPVLVVGRAQDPLPHGCARVGLPAMADLPGWLTPLTAVVPAQLVARRTAQLRGVDVDRPGALSKVTLTR